MISRLTDVVMAIADGEAVVIAGACLTMGSLIGYGVTELRNKRRMMKDRVPAMDRQGVNTMSEELTIWEGVAGYFYYHLSTGGRKDILCGNTEVMTSGLPLDTWGMVTHLGEKYCKECERIYRNSTDKGVDS